MLRTPSTGLLTSNVSWEDVEKVVDAKYHGAAAFGPKKRISPLGLGIGLQSLLGVVDPDWKTNGKITLPSNFALKIASPVVMLQVMMSEAAKLPPELTAQMSSVVDEFVSFLTPCHNSEMFFYEFFENCAKRCEIVPRYHFGTKLTEDNQSRAFLAVEMIENAKSGTIVQSLTDVQMEQVLKSLARMQAAFVDAPDDVIQKAPHQGLSGVYNTIKDFILVLNNRALSSLLPPELASLTENFEKALPQIITTSEIDELAAKMGIGKVFVHGDFWAANFLWNDDTLVKIVDFQMSHFGLAATDLTRLFNTCLSPADRRAKWQTYLKFYHDQLTKEFQGHKIPFTYQQLEKTYKLVYPRTSALLLPALLATLQTLTKSEAAEEQKTVTAKLILEKIVGIYVDILA